MTADESGARGGQDARGLGALTHQSAPEGRFVLQRDGLELVIWWRAMQVTIELGASAGTIAEEPGYSFALAAHEAAYLAGLLTMASGVRLG